MLDFLVIDACRLSGFFKRNIGLIFCRPFQATPPTFTTFWAWWRGWVVFPHRSPPSRLRGSTTTKATTPKRRGRRQNTPSTYHHLHPHLQRHAAALQPRSHPYWMTLANQHLKVRVYLDSCITVPIIGFSDLWYDCHAAYRDITTLRRP